MNQHENPQFEQHDGPDAFEWSNPITNRAAHCIDRYAAREGLALRETTSPADDMGGMDHRVELLRDDNEIALVRQVVGEDYGVHIVGFNFTIIEGVYETIRFYIHDNVIRLYVAEDTKILGANPSQEAARVMGEVNNSIDGLMAAWINEPEKYNFQLRGGDDKPISKEMREMILQHLASMLR